MNFFRVCYFLMFLALFCVIKQLSTQLDVIAPMIWNLERNLEV